MNTTKYHNPFPDGKRWKLTPDGIKVEGEGVPRSKGHPHTVLTLWKDFGEDILQAAWETACPVDMVVAMVPIEARRLKGTLHFDPKSSRKEPGYISDKQTPHRRSVGLMQTLLSTAKHMDKIFGLNFPVSTPLLEDPYYSLLYGSAYISYQIMRYGMDPILICGAYNAGSLRQTHKNDWKILTYGPTRMDRYTQWFNDFHFCLQEGLIEIPKNSILSLPLTSNRA